MRPRLFLCGHLRIFQDEVRIRSDYRSASRLVEISESTFFFGAATFRLLIHYGRLDQTTGYRDRADHHKESPLCANAPLSILLRTCYLSALSAFKTLLSHFRFLHTNMFSFLHSAAAKLAAHSSRSIVVPLESGIFVERSYDPKFHGDLVGRLRAIESQDQILLGNVRSLGRRVFGQLRSFRFSTCPA